MFTMCVMHTRIYSGEGEKALNCKLRSPFFGVVAAVLCMMRNMMDRYIIDLEGSVIYLSRYRVAYCQDSQIWEVKFSIFNPY